MPAFEQVAWFPLCAGLTGVGLVATWFAWRRRGVAAGLRGVGWSLLPLAAYLVGVIGVLWDVGTAIAGWALRLVVSPAVWIGVALVGVSVVAFVASGVLRRRGVAGRADRRREEARSLATSTSPTREVGTGSGSTGDGSSPPSGAASGDDDFSDVEEILRRRGIS